MKKKIFIPTILLLIASVIPTEAKVEVTHLTIEGRKAPMGLDVESPRFGWQIMADRKNVMQKSYHIIVASTLEKLNRNDGDVWNSGVVNSDASQWIPLTPSSLLQAGHSYYWKVKITTNKGKSEWSQPATWSTGLLKPSNWKGQWIGIDSLMPWDKNERHSRLSARYLRKVFSINRHSTILRATMYISGLGYYTLHINGKRVGNDLLTPLPTDYTKTVAYDTYDVTSYLDKKNAIGVTLEGGHYFAQTQNYQSTVRATYGQPRMIANLVIEYQDGTKETIVTDPTWRISADGSIRYANEYDGELYNANLRFKGWDCIGFDDSKWLNAQVMNAPGGVLCGNLSPNVHIYQTEKPVSFHQFGERYIIDFGTNNAGRVRIKLAQTIAGDTIRIRHAELLQKGDSLLYTKNLRSAEATARYVADGKAVDWAPEFTFYGFRYVEITGVKHLSASDITRELIADRMDDSHTDLSITDRKDNDMLNRIVENARRGIRSNYKGMPIVPPTR